MYIHPPTWLVINGRSQELFGSRQLLTPQNEGAAEAVGNAGETYKPSLISLSNQQRTAARAYLC